MVKHWIALLLVSLLAACGATGGHDSTPTVSDITVTNFYYGVRATFLFSGANLDQPGLSVEVPNCAGQTPVFSSSVQQALSCVVASAGEIGVKVKNGSGTVVFAKAFTVPAPRVVLQTTLGDITAELDPAAAPLSVNNFLQYVGSGFYSNTIFHRVIAGFVIQGGGFLSGMVPQLRSNPIALESDNGLHNLRGTLAMARTDEPNSATSQFYFNLVDNPALDFLDAANPGYAVFGKIVQGLDVMDAIGAVPTAAQSGFSDVPVTDVVVKAIVRVQ